MVLEFNTRFGDPETQALMLRLDMAKTDIVEVFAAAIDGNADKVTIAMKPGASVCVIAASSGYPGKYPVGHIISGVDALTDSDEVIVFHSGTADAPHETGKLVTSGGRVLGVTAYAPALQDALSAAYERLGKIGFEGMQFRRDIGWRALHQAEIEQR